MPCPDCEEEEDRAYQLIEAHLAEGGAPTLAGVMQATGVRAAVIRRLVQRGRIHLADASATRTCALCGQSLPSEGQICSRCAERMRADRHGPKNDPPSPGRMYSAGDERRC